MPDLLSTLAGQVQDYSDEDLTCVLYELKRRQPPLGSFFTVQGAFRRRHHAPRGLVEAHMPNYNEMFAWPCRSQTAIRQLLERWNWSPFKHYFLVLRRGRAGGSDGFPWPPPLEIDLGQGDFAFDADSPITLLDQLQAVLRNFFRERDGCFTKVLYMKEFKTGEHSLAWEAGQTQGWKERLMAACAEAVYTLVGEC
jgi:hypothetical protein